MYTGNTARSMLMLQLIKTAFRRKLYKYKTGEKRYKGQYKHA